MALIEGEEITHRDLLPVFDGFLKDLDEVRIGVLKHLADFLKVRLTLQPGGSSEHLRRPPPPPPPPPRKKKLAEISLTG